MEAPDSTIDRSIFLFDKFYQLNILHESGDINDLYFDSELLILACVTIACSENGREEQKTLVELTAIFDDVNKESVEPYISIMRESLERGF